MKAEETRGWKFKSPPNDDSCIKCPSCQQWSPLSEWEEGYVYCETCGDHSTMDCPKCSGYFDHVNADYPPFEVK